MQKHPSHYELLLLYIKPNKTRQEMCAEYNMTYKVFKRKLALHSIELPPGTIVPNDQKLIYETWGFPPLPPIK